MTAQDWAQLGMLVDDSAMNWYVMTHPGSSVPAPAATATVSVPGLRGSVNTNLLIIGAVVLVAVLLLR